MGRNINNALEDAIIMQITLMAGVPDQTPAGAPVEVKEEVIESFIAQIGGFWAQESCAPEEPEMVEPAVEVGREHPSGQPANSPAQTDLPWVSAPGSEAGGEEKTVSFQPVPLQPGRAETPENGAAVLSMLTRIGGFRAQEGCPPGEPETVEPAMEGARENPPARPAGSPAQTDPSRVWAPGPEAGGEKKTASFQPVPFQPGHAETPENDTAVFSMDFHVPNSQADEGPETPAADLEPPIEVASPRSEIERPKDAARPQRDAQEIRDVVQHYKSPGETASNSGVSRPVPDSDDARASQPDEAAESTSGPRAKTEGRPVRENPPASPAEKPEKPVEPPSSAPDSAGTAGSGAGRKAGATAAFPAQTRVETATGNSGRGTTGEVLYEAGTQALPGNTPAAGRPAETGAAFRAQESPAPRQNDFMFQLAERVSISLRDGKGEIRVRLRPDNLGGLEIRAESSQNGVVARIAVESSTVKNYLESNLHLLHESLQDQGLRIDRVHVSLQDSSPESFPGSSSESGHARSGYSGNTGGGRMLPQHEPAAGNALEERAADPSPWRAHPGARFYTVA